MDQALGLDKRSLFVVSRWNAHAIEFAWSMAPVVCDIFSIAVKACVEVQLNWLSWLPGWRLGSGAEQPEGSCNAAIESEEHWRNRLAHSMDIAVGAEPAGLGPTILTYDRPHQANYRFAGEPEEFNPATLAAAALESPGDLSRKPVQPDEPAAETAIAVGA